MNTDELQAGRELDVQIATEVMGWQRGHDDPETIISDDPVDCEDYFEPFLAWDVFVESSNGELREYLYGVLDLDVVPECHQWAYGRVVLPEWSEDENDAGLIIDHLVAQGCAVTVYTEPIQDQGVKSRCEIVPPTGCAIGVIADTRPLAICRAALMVGDRWGES